MSSLQRRQLLGSVAAAAIATPVSAQEDRPAASLAFFTAEEARFVAAVVDRLIPADDFPSASQAGVVVYIDRQLAGDFGRGERMYLQGPFASGKPEQGYQLGLPPAALYRQSLQALLSDEVGRSFAGQPPERQDALLRELEAGQWQLGDVPSSVFFETLLANAIEGYFADPAYGGNRDMAGWKMIGFPGAYAHYADWVGRHNARFDRPPVAIASQRAPERHHPSGPIPASARPAGSRER